MCSVHLCSRSRKIAARAARTQGSSSPLKMLAWNDKIMSVVGRMDEMHILTVVWAAPIVGYLSPSHICIVDVCYTLTSALMFS